MTTPADEADSSSRSAAHDAGLVSVIIPTFNRARIVGQAIDSALQQSHRNVEVLVIDDGSTDGTDCVVSARYAQQPRVRYIRQSNGGVSNARNRGLAEARGEFIAFLDSDDLWLPWKLELQLHCLRQLPEAGMIWSDMSAVDADGRLLRERYLRTMYGAYRWFPGDTLFAHRRHIDPGVLGDASGLPAQLPLHWGTIYPQMIMGNLVHTSTVLVRRSRQVMVGGFDEALKYSGEDYDFHLRTCRAGPVALIDVPTVRYTIGASDQLTRPAYGVHIASNALTVVTAALAADRGRIDLKPAMLRARLAKLHRWVGEEQAGAGRRAEARRSLLRSLAADPWEARTWLLALAACLPAEMVARLRRLRSRRGA